MASVTGGLLDDMLLRHGEPLDEDEDDNGRCAVGVGVRQCWSLIPQHYKTAKVAAARRLCATLSPPLEAHANPPCITHKHHTHNRSFEAFERAYAADHSWESLQEDEQGFLRPVVSW